MGFDSGGSWDNSEYSALDDIWYNIGAATTTVSDKVGSAVDTVYSGVKSGVGSVVDTVKSPFVAVYENFDTISATMKWGIIAVVGIGAIWLASNLGIIALAAKIIVNAGGIAKDSMRLFGHFV